MNGAKSTVSPNPCVKSGSNGPKNRIISNILIFCIHGLRPILGSASCKYPISCGNFAVDQLRSEPLFKALYAIVRRLFLCNPWNKNLT